MIYSWYVLLLSLILPYSEPGYSLPIGTYDRKSIGLLELTEIGEFGMLRKERPNVPSHYHTGIDIKRPTNNYQDEAIYPIHEGVVISMRQDGPYAQIIIEHESHEQFWTVYEHISGIKVDLFDHVNPDSPIARFMNRDELDRYGWQFDHFHFEVLRIPPIKLKRDNTKPSRLFASYTLMCKTKGDLDKYFYDPIDFLAKRLE